MRWRRATLKSADALAQPEPETGSERQLAELVRRQPVPAHIAIIMDGNGRWATQRGYPRIAGHHEERALFRLKMPEDARSRASRFHRPAQPAGEARRQRGHGAALDAFHQLLGDDEPVLGRHEHRPADAAHACDHVERLTHCCSSQRRAITVARCARIASRPSGMPRSRTTSNSAPGVGWARCTLPC